MAWCDAPFAMAASPRSEHRTVFGLRSHQWGAAPDPAPVGARLPDTRWLPSAPLGSGKTGPQWDLLAGRLALLRLVVTLPHGGWPSRSLRCTRLRCAPYDSCARSCGGRVTSRRELAAPVRRPRLPVIREALVAIGARVPSELPCSDTYLELS